LSKLDWIPYRGKSIITIIRSGSEEHSDHPSGDWRFDLVTIAIEPSVYSLVDIF